MLLGIWLLSPEDAIQQYKAAKQFHPDVAAGMAKGEDYETINRRMSVRQARPGRDCPPTGRDRPRAVR